MGHSLNESVLKPAQEKVTWGELAFSCVQFPGPSFEGQLLLGALGLQTPCCPWCLWALILGSARPGVAPCSCMAGHASCHLPWRPRQAREHGVARAGQCQPVWEVGGDAENTRGGGPVRLARAAGGSAGPPFCFWGGDSTKTKPLEPVLVGGGLHQCRQWVSAGL